MRPEESCINSSFQSQRTSRDKNPTMLCKVCSSILQNQVGLIARRPEHLLFAHHATVFSLRSSVSQGCYVCRAFCNELFSSDQGFFLSENLTHLVTHCLLRKREITVLSITVPRSYTLSILLVESSNIPNLAVRKGNGTIFVMQPSSGQLLSYLNEICNLTDLLWLFQQIWMAIWVSRQHTARHQMSAGSL